MLKRKVSTYCKNDARFQFFFLSPASRLKGGTEKVQRVVARAREQGDIETDEGYDGGRREVERREGPAQHRRA